MTNKTIGLLDHPFFAIDNRLASIQDKKFPTAAKFIVTQALSLQKDGLKLDAMSMSDMENAYGFGLSVIKKAIKFLKSSGFCSVKASGYKTKSGATAKAPSVFVIDKEKFIEYLELNTENPNKDDNDLSRKSTNPRAKIDQPLVENRPFINKRKEDHKEDNIDIDNSFATQKQSAIFSQDLEAMLVSEKQTAIENKERLYFVSDLCNQAFPNCIEAMRVLSDYKDEGYNIYTGNMTIEDWSDCESQMAMVDFDAVAYFEMFEIQNRFNTFKKKSGGSLKDFLMVNSEHDFESFYNYLTS